MTFTARRLSECVNHVEQTLRKKNIQQPLFFFQLEVVSAPLGGVDIDPATTYSQIERSSKTKPIMERSSDSVKPSKTAGMRWSRMSVMRQLRMSITWLGLICLMMVEATEGSVGQNIQYPQVRVLYKCKDTLSSPEYLFKLLLTFTNTKAYFSALPPLWALFVLFQPNSGQIISLLARDAFGFSGVLPVPRVPRQNPSKSSQATVSSNPGDDPSMLLIFSDQPQKQNIVAGQVPWCLHRRRVRRPRANLGQPVRRPQQGVPPSQSHRTEHPWRLLPVRADQE